MKIQVIYDTEDHSVMVCNNREIKPLLKNDDEWIKCTDQLPFNSKNKLVIDRCGLFFVASYTGSVEKWKERFTRDKLINVTYWRELPERPEETK